MRARTVLLSAVLAILLSSPPTDAALIYDWSKSFALPSSTQANSVAKDLWGNILVAGTFSGAVDFGGGPITSAGADDIFLAKYDAQGNYLWSRSFGGFGYEFCNSVAVDGSGNIIIVGQFRYGVDFGGGILTSAGNDDIFVAKFDPDGNHQWSKRFGDSKNQYGIAVAADDANNIAVVGYFNGTLDFGGSPLVSGAQINIFVVEFDADGSHLWSRSAGDDTFQRCNTVAMDASGNVIIAGEFSGSMDLGDGLLTSAGGDDIFLAKYDDQGNHLWSRQFGDAEYQRCYGIAVDGSENVVLTGYFNGSVDFGGGTLVSVDAADAYLASFDGDGNHRWSKSFSGGSDQLGSAMTIDSSDNITISGFFEESVDFGGGLLTSPSAEELFIASFDRDGMHRFSKGFAGPKYSLGTSIAAADSGKVVFSGGFSDSVDVGGGSIAAGHSDHGFVAELDDGGSHQWSFRVGQLTGYGYSGTMAIDGAHNLVITGGCQLSVDFGTGVLPGGLGYDVFVAKFDENGNALWNRRFGDGGTQTGRAVAVDGVGNVILSGSFRSSVDFGGGELTSPGESIYLAKFDGDGNHQWSRGFGDATSRILAFVATAAAGRVVLAGSLVGDVDFGGGNLSATDSSQDIFVASFDADGNHLWSKRFVGIGEQTTHGVAVDPQGNVVLAGSLSGSIDFGGGPLTSAGDQDVFVASFDANGNHRWSHEYGDSEPQQAASVATDGAGNVIITGTFQGSVDFGGGPLNTAGFDDIFVASFDSNGNHRWSRGFGSHFYEHSPAITANAAGTVVLTGSMNGAVDFGGGPLAGTGSDSVFLAAFDSDGIHLWSERYEGLYEQLPTSVAIDGSDRVSVLGHNTDSIDFGGGPLGGNIFIAHFSDTQVPVRFANFEARPRQRVVELRWDVWSNDPRERYVLYRRDMPGAQDVAIASGRMQESSGIYLDEGVAIGGTYEYQLAVQTTGGDEQRSTTVTVTIPLLRTTLAQNFPNPFNPKTSIEYTLGEQLEAVVLDIYDTAGRRVARLDQGPREAGTYRVEWDGRDGRGKALSSGVYLYRLEGVRGVGARKMLLVR